MENAIPQVRLSEKSWSFPRSGLVGFSEKCLWKFDKQQDFPFLPPKRSPWILRHVRYTLFTVYQRLFTAVVLLNIIPLILAVQIASSSPVVLRLDHYATAASTNFLLAILVRQDYFVNGIFRTAWLVPWRLPLRVRRWIARCYCYGGLHSGAAVAGTLWWTAFSWILTTTLWKEGTYTIPLAVVALTILAFLLIILVTSAPKFRKRWHNCFELTHRLLGWTSVALFWAQLVLLSHYNATMRSTTTHRAEDLEILIHAPTFWILILITAMLIYPWLSVRRWTFTPEVLSPHALRLHFPHTIHKMSVISISTHPLREWHPFAVFPSSMNREPVSHSNEHPSSMIVSNAGNWTRALIHRAQSDAKHTEQHHDHDPNISLESISANPNAPPQPQPPSLKLYTRTTPRAGVLSLTTIFARVVIITTGSGIGPSLSSLLDRPAAQRIRLVWSARAPRRTYGARMLELVYRADPDAVIIDTEGEGRPDLVRVALREVRSMEGGAEAVFVLGNEKVTRKVVYGLEARGVPAFGPVWDS